MPRLALSLLGTFEVTLDGQSATGFESAKVRALLAYLAIEADRPQRREFLASLLWPDLPDEVARTNLRQALANLRRVIADSSADPPFLDITREHVQFNRASDHWLDVAAFPALLAATATHAHRRAATCGSCRQRLQEAVTLYRGPLLAQFFLGDSAAFEEWALFKRERLQRQALAALARLVDACLAQGQYAEAQEYARRQVELDPWREEAHRQLMSALWLGNERSAALAQYERCRRLLEQEMGVEPADETTDLYERMRSGEGLVDERLVVPVVHLPRLLTPFIGREPELAELGSLLEQPACRLITLVGSGGAGKTRLAVKAASDQSMTFSDGVFFVPLAPVPSGESLVPVIATALAFTFSGSANPKAQLLDYLREKEVLLVMDNAEHLLGPEDSAVDLVVELLDQAPSVAILVTSRERLRLQSEWVLEVVGLPYPPDEQAENLSDYSAVQLFTQRARQARVGFAPTRDDWAHVGRICRLVTGLPLGIELAATWVGTQACREIADDIERNLLTLATTYRDVPARHRTLRAVLDYSWHLLSEDEQRVLRQVAVFRGGFGQAAAEDIAGASASILAALVNKSLLQSTPVSDTTPRYDLHELVRQYGEEQLQAAGETEPTRDRHLTVYLRQAEVAEPELSGDQQAVWLARLEDEHANLRAALQWVLARRDVERSLRLAGVVWRFWRLHGHLSEGRRWLEQVLRLAEGAVEDEGRPLPAPDPHLAEVLRGAGVLAQWQGDYAAARAFHERSLVQRRELGDEQGMAHAMNNLAIVAAEQGDFAAARTYFHESLALARRQGDERAIADALNNLAIVAAEQGDYAAARASFEEGLEQARQFGDTWGTAASLHNLGELAQLQGDYAAARTFLEEGLALRREVGDTWAIAHSLTSLGTVTQLQGDYVAAYTLHRDSLVMFRDLDDRNGIAEALEGVGAVAAAQGSPPRAVRIAAAAMVLREALNAPLAPMAQAAFDRWLALARAGLSDSARAAAEAEGQAMALEHAIAYALDQPR